MTYQALYRKYRPKHLKEVLGQEHVTRTLLNSVRQGRIGHAYLFSGPRGTGKTTVARILARVINCENPVDGEPCDKCARCRGADEGLGVLEIDAASHGSVDDMRQLVAQVSQVPLSGGMMVYIIDEVHMLSKEAFNAFLKTLEEPPPHAVFVLATTEPAKLLPTIHSRCQHFAFRRLPIELVADHILSICKREGVTAEESAIRLIARAGEGSVRDSISVLEQAIAFEPEGLTLNGVREVLGIPDRVDIRKLAGHIIRGDPGAVSQAFSSLIESGREPSLVIADLLSHFRDLLLAKLGVRNSELLTLPPEELNLVSEQAGLLAVDGIHDAITALARCESDMKWEEEAALVLEVSLLKLAREMGRRPEDREDKTEPAEADRHPVAERSGRKGETQAAAPPAAAPVERKPASLTGGVTLKRRPAAEQEKPPVKPEVELTVKMPDDAEPFWRETLENIRKASPSMYVLLAEAQVSPPPSAWPGKEALGPSPLMLRLVYPPGRSLVAKMVSEPSLLKALSEMLSSVLDRSVLLSVSKQRTAPADESSETVVSPPKTSLPFTTLFEGAGRPAPADPELRQIHELLIRDFPDYKIESDGPRAK